MCNFFTLKTTLTIRSFKVSLIQEFAVNPHSIDVGSIPTNLHFLARKLTSFTSFVNLNRQFKVTLFTYNPESKQTTY